MLLVKLELWPHGNEAAKRDVGELRIANVSKFTAISEYKVDAWESRSDTDLRRFAFPSIKHRRDDGALALLARVLAKILPDLEAV
jgi:hypothetical protein